MAAIKTYDKGICRHCNKEVEWSDGRGDYITTGPHANSIICWDAPAASADHSPLPPKSANFTSLYEKLSYEG